MKKGTAAVLQRNIYYIPFQDGRFLFFFIPAGNGSGSHACMDIWHSIKNRRMQGRMWKNRIGSGIVYSERIFYSIEKQSKAPQQAAGSLALAAVAKCLQAVTWLVARGNKMIERDRMMKRWISILLGAVVFVSALLMPGMDCEAAPVETGVTTLSDAAFFRPEWAQMKLTITCGGKSWEKPVSELMGQQMRLYTDPDNGANSCSFVQIDWADAFLEEVNAELRSPEFVNPAVPEGYCYQFVEGFEAWYLNVVQAQLLSGPVNNINVDLNANTCKVITVAEAEAAAALADTADYVLAGTCTTSFRGSNAARINNIRVAAEKMNGYVLMSGAVASLDAIFTPRTSANGYKSAGIYLGGRLVNGMGGGICQVSSTAYNALMNAGITVTMRYPHSSPVSYLPLGTDAAISAGSKDLQFRNDYLHPVKLETVVEGKNLTVNVYVKAGDMNGVTYQLWAKKTSDMSAKTYLTVYVNGVEAEVREVGTCRYQPLKKEEDAED